MRPQNIKADMTFETIIGVAIAIIALLVLISVYGIIREAVMAIPG